MFFVFNIKFLCIFAMEFVFFIVCKYQYYGKKFAGIL